MMTNSMFPFSFVILLSACGQEYELNGKFDGNDGELSDDVSLDSGLIDDGLTDDNSTDDTEPAYNETPPVAVCEANPTTVTPPFESATWIGSDSYDPNNQQITFQWELLSAPEGTAMSLNSNQPDVSGFTPDQAGSYTARLTVRNEEGLADTCEATLDAIPVQSLWIEMFWQHPGDDMDLHLIAPGYDWNSAKTTEQDCYYGNCTWGGLDWGSQGDTADNPALDIDDIPGTGPENINISEPESIGAYTIVVHDYPGSTYTEPNEVTIKVHLNGVMVYTATKTIVGEDQYVPFAMVDWAQSMIIPL